MVLVAPMGGADLGDGRCRLAKPEPAQSGTLACDRALKRSKPKVLAFQLPTKPGLGGGEAAGLLSLVKSSDELAGNPQLGGEVGYEMRVPPLEATWVALSLVKKRRKGCGSGAVECQADWTVW